MIANHVMKHQRSFSEMAKFNKVKPAKSSIESLVLLLQYRNNFGKSLRQRNISADNTKDSAGTMPAYVYANINRNKV